MNKIGFWYLVRGLSVSLLIFIVLTGGGEPQMSGGLDYGTKSDSSLHYFNLGWHQILDNGQWTKAEAPFIKSIEFDSSFTLGKSLVGRISRDQKESEEIKKFVK